MQISLAMIVRDEEKHIAECLDSAIPFVDAVVVVDTGSTDRTIEILTQYKRKHLDSTLSAFTIAQREWTDDFAKARNQSFELCVGDFILWLDADDRLRGDPEQLRKELEHLDKDDMGFLALYHYAINAHGGSELDVLRQSVVRNVPEMKWQYPIHEVLPFSERCKLTESMTIDHVRDLDDVTKDNRRNIEILAKKYDEGNADFRMGFYYGLELAWGGKHEEAIEILGEICGDETGSIEERNAAGLQYMESMCIVGRQAQCIRFGDWHKDILLLTGNARFHCIMGDAYGKMGDKNSAIKEYELACTCEDPRKTGRFILWIQDKHYTWYPHAALITLYAEAGRLDKALEHCDAALGCLPKQQSLLDDRRILLGQISDTSREVIQKKEDQKITVGSRLNLGGGTEKIEDFLNCDHYDPHADIQFDMSEVFPIDDNTIAEIRSHHSLEHLPRRDAIHCLKECFRILQPGGEFELSIPDLYGCCSLYMLAANEEDSDLRDWYRRTIYGRQVTDGKKDLGQFHYTGFGLTEMRDVLIDIGFKIDTMKTLDENDTPSMEFKCHKSVTSTEIEENGLSVLWISSRDQKDPAHRLRCDILAILASSRGKMKISFDFDLGELGGGHDVVVTNRVQGDLIEYHSRCCKVILNMNEDLLSLGQNPKGFRDFDAVVCCSSELADKMRPYNDHVFVVEDAVDIFGD